MRLIAQEERQPYLRLVTVVLAGLLTACAGASPPSGTASADEAAETEADDPASEAKERTAVRVASIPMANALSMHVAEKRGIYDELGLDVSFTFFDSGAPMVEAGLAGEWDAAWAGAPPSMSAFRSYGLIIPGLIAEESALMPVFGRPGEIDRGNPGADLEGGQALLSVNSTGHYVFEACLVHLGLDPGAMQIVPLDPANVVGGFDSGEGTVAQTWPPHAFRLFDAGYEAICDGSEAGVEVYANYLVHPDFWESSPDVAARLIRAWYSANEWIKENPEDAIVELEAFYDIHGVTLSQENLRRDIEERNWYSLSDAIEAFEGGAAREGLTAMAQFFVNAGVYDEIPDIDQLLNQGLEILKAAAEF